MTKSEEEQNEEICSIYGTEIIILTADYGNDYYTSLSNSISVFQTFWTHRDQNWSYLHGFTIVKKIINLIILWIMTLKNLLCY
jgi:hypothetical protein